MKNINNYANLAAYTADTNRPTGESAVSLISDGTGVRFDGKNVLTLSPGVGDIVVWDAVNSVKKFLKYGTYNAATLPAGITIIGVVYNRTGNTIRVVSKNNAASASWAAPFKVKLTGFDFATGGSITLTVNSTTTAAIAYLTTDTLASVATAIASALTASGFTSALGWSVVADNTNNCVVVTRSYYTPTISTFVATDAATKVTATIIAADKQTVLSGVITPYGGAYRNDGVLSWVGANFEKMYSYYYTTGGTDTAQGVGASTIVKYSVFNITDNPLLVAAYGTGEAGYANYIQAKMVRYPYSKGGIIDENGKSNTAKLIAVTYVDVDGTTKPHYPAANNAALYGVTGMVAGSWWLPANREMYLLIKDAKLDNTDKVNMSLTAIGGDKVLASVYYPWCSAEYNSNFSWISYGYYGSLLNYYKFTSNRVRPVSAFQLL